MPNRACHWRVSSKGDGVLVDDVIANGVSLTQQITSALKRCTGDDLVTVSHDPKQKAQSAAEYWVTHKYVVDVTVKEVQKAVDALIKDEYLFKSVVMNGKNGRPTIYHNNKKSKAPMVGIWFDDV